MRACWCGTGNKDLVAISHEYLACTNGCALVSKQGLSADQLIVQKDDTGFYWKQYLLDHQSQDLDFPDIHARARNDLSKHNLHWFKTLLKYCLPTAKALELGYSHGSFVALLNQSGYAMNPGCK